MEEYFNGLLKEVDQRMATTAPGMDGKEVIGVCREMVSYLKGKNRELKEYALAHPFAGDAKEILCDPNAPETEKAQQLPVLEQLWEQGFTVAAHQLGKCWWAGLGVLPDDDRAEQWFRRSAEAGNDFSHDHHGME